MKAILYFYLLAMTAMAQDYHIYYDADFSVYKESTDSIRKGFEAGVKFFNEKNGTKYHFKYIPLDHRGNTRRSLMNLKEIIKDQRALLTIAGIHSPPLITNNDFINQNKILTLVPWAAGGPITRSKVEENWIYRLSIDDTKAGEFLVNSALADRSCSRSSVLIEDTPWGRTNSKKISSALSKNKNRKFFIHKFFWGISQLSSLRLANKMKSEKVNCIFFVGNAKDGMQIFQALGELKNNAPVYSHWGITGGNTALIGKIIKENKIKLKVIQTKFSFLDAKRNIFQQEALEFILKNYGYKESGEIRPMTGWVHSFDFSQIVMTAIDQIKKRKEELDKNSLKKELENMKVPVMGLIKNYEKPFSQFSKKRIDAHEALGVEDFMMKEIMEDGLVK